MSLVFSGNLSSVLQINMVSQLYFGTGDFTIAWWQYEIVNQPFPRSFSVGTFPSSQLAFDTESGDTVYYWSNGNPTSIYTLTDEQRYNVWIHYALCRISGVMYIYMNGVQIISLNETSDFDFTQTLWIGGENFANTSSFDGYIYGFTWLVGTALYTGNFTPTVDPPTAEYQLNLTGGNLYAVAGVTVTNNGVGLDGPLPEVGDVGGDPQIRTLDGHIYTVPNYLKVFDYVCTKNTHIQCTTRAVTAIDYPNGIPDHDGKQRVMLPYTSDLLPHTYMDTLNITDRVLGSCQIEMDTLRILASEGRITCHIPTTKRPMVTPLREYPLLTTTSELIIRLTDLTLHLWSDTTLMERHNVHCQLHISREGVTGAIVEQPSIALVPIKLEDPLALKIEQDPIIKVLTINGVPTSYTLREVNGPLNLLDRLLAHYQFIAEPV